MGETDISGLRLLEAHFGLDSAAEGLDLTSSNTGSVFIAIHVFSHSSPRPLSSHSGLFPTKLSVLSLYGSCLGFTATTKIYLLYVAHVHSFPEVHQLHCWLPASLLPLCTPFPSIHSVWPRWEGPKPNFQ